MEEPQKLFRLPGNIEEEEECENDNNSKQNNNPSRAESPLLSQKSHNASLIVPRNVTLVRENTQNSSIGNMGRQDSNRYLFITSLNHCIITKFQRVVIFRRSKFNKI